MVTVLLVPSVCTISALVMSQLAVETVTSMCLTLLFFLGVEVGENDNVLNSLNKLGLEALLLSIAGTAGSIALAWALWKSIKRKEGGPNP